MKSTERDFMKEEEDREGEEEKVNMALLLLLFEPSEGSWSKA